MGISATAQIISSSKPTQLLSASTYPLKIHASYCVQRDHDRVGFDEDITCVSGGITVIRCYFVVNSDLSLYYNTVVGIIISTVFLC